MPRVIAVALAASALASFLGCDGAKAPPGAMAPAGEGYDENLHVLSHDDCIALRDHQIDISVTVALAGDAGTETVDADAREILAAKLRETTKAETDAWVARCTGRRVSANDFRCLREATTPKTFNDCGAIDETKKDADDAAN